MDDTPIPDPYAPDLPAEPTAPEVPAVALGQTMPDIERLPTLQPALQALPAAGGPARLSTLAQGLAFTGTALIQGSVTVAGEVQGNLSVQGQPDGHVTVTETGSVQGDISAPNISVLGHTQGLLDAAGGRVTLHASACVDGRIRYTHLQVNGADLNAQLERVRPDGPNGRGLA